MRFKRYAPPPYSTVQPFHVETVGGDFGAPSTTTFVNDGPPVAVKVRELSDEELVRAGIATTRTLYRLWTDSPQTYLIEGRSVKYPAKDAALVGGNHKVTTVITYPERGIVQFEIERT